MYPYYGNVLESATPELIAFEKDLDDLGMISTLEEWFITEAWAMRFKAHFQKLLVQAEAGNALAQSALGTIYFFGCCYTSREEHKANYDKDIVEMTYWLLRSTRQGVVAAIDLLISMGVGPEVERLRGIFREVDAEVKQGKRFPLGETWRRAYGQPVSETAGASSADATQTSQRPKGIPHK